MILGLAAVVQYLT